MTPVPWVPRYFFLIDTGGSRRSCVSGALSNRKHSLFHIRYFENGPLEPGSVKREKVEKRLLVQGNNVTGEAWTPEFEVLAPLLHTPPQGSLKYLFPDSHILAREMVKYTWTIIGWSFCDIQQLFSYTMLPSHGTHPVWHCPQKSCACNLQISQLSACRKLANQSRRLRWFPKLTLESLANEKTDNEYNLQ